MTNAPTVPDEQPLAAFPARQAAWCAATGLRRSRARYTSVLRWLDPYSLPAGFDHTGVYYCPKRRMHILLTEPYHSTERALLALEELARKRGGFYSVAIGLKGTGLWYPGPCIPLLVGSWRAEAAMEIFTTHLPGEAA